MGKKNQNFVMFKGDDLVQEFLHVGPFWLTQRQVISLEASDEINFRFHADGNPGTVHFTKTRAGGGIEVVTSGYHETNDTMRVKFDAGDTSGLPSGEYGYQLEVVYGGSDEVVVASGVIQISERA